jgi:hypothetical protein
MAARKKKKETDDRKGLAKKTAGTPRSKAEKKLREQKIKGFSERYFRAETG